MIRRRRRVANARDLVAAGADIVKFEGAHLAILEALAAASIEVCCHLGLEPQTHLEKRVKGRSAQEALQAARRRAGRSTARA